MSAEDPIARDAARLSGRPPTLFRSRFHRTHQRSFFGFHVSSVGSTLSCSRALGRIRTDLRWHCDLFVTYAAAFERGATYVPGAVAYFRQLPTSYGTTGTFVATLK